MDITAVGDLHNKKRKSLNSTLAILALGRSLSILAPRSKYNPPIINNLLLSGKEGEKSVRVEAPAVFVTSSVCKMARYQCVVSIIIPHSPYLNKTKRPTIDAIEESTGDNIHVFGPHRQP